jgi:hypothetical protein
MLLEWGGKKTMTLRLILSVLYFGIGGLLIGGAFLGSGRIHSEISVALVTLLGILAFPSSYLVSYVVYSLGLLIWPDGIPWIVARLELVAILVIGYVQWFYLVPFLFNKVRAIF